MNHQIELPQAQVDAIIRTKRKAREPKACYPCHTRKVKCDRQLPCDACVKRDHADLCSYERPSKKQQIAVHNYSLSTDPESATSLANNPHASFQLTSGFASPALDSSNSVSIPKQEWDNICTKLTDMEHTIARLRKSLERTGGGGEAFATPASNSKDEMMSDDNSNSTSTGMVSGIHAKNDLGGGTVHLGSRSVMAYILGKHSSSQDAVQALLEENMLPKLGLDNESVTYPFVDLWSSDPSSYDIRAVCKAMPEDRQCRELFACYRDIAGIIYPVIVDIKTLEGKLELLLQNRGLNGPYSQPDRTDHVYGVELSYVGLLFAVIASGAQSSNLSSKERELTSQVYICCAYQCLRMTNFVSAPSFETIQTMMIVCNALSYNMNPGISYIMLGMTIRMGISIGLQVESKEWSQEEAYHRRRVWWSLAWQESHFSISYDRPTTLAHTQPSIAYDPTSSPGNRSYYETMCRIISLTFEIVRSRMQYPNSHMTYHTIYNYKDNVARIVADGKPHLRDHNYCHSRVHHLERLALKLHASYITSELCRPALNPPHDANDAETTTLRHDCRIALEGTLEAYLELQIICHNAARSWIGIQRAFSAAFLLAVLEESKVDKQVWSLLQQLENVLVERTTADGMFSLNAVNGIGVETTTGSPPLGNVAATMAKSLRALRKLNAAFRAQQAQGSSEQTNSRQTSPHHGAPGGHRSRNSLARILSDPSATASMLGTGSAAIQPGTSSAVSTPAISNLTHGMPVTPDTSSTTSGEWNINAANLFERAGEFISPALWR